MLSGFNTNVPYRGDTYHVQTEGSGPQNPVITTLVYLKGAILASEKTSYAHLLKEENWEEKVTGMMKDRHRSVIKELLSGKYITEA